ncbi:MAG: hypothetical protein LBJ02_05845 [Bifidobacteriaceae bacterium]|nr:hypothetical protein [Bifidobacteriaceae bacterium]
MRAVEGSDGLRIGCGDLIQTRRNDAKLGVANRQTWIVSSVDGDGRVWVNVTGHGRNRPRVAVLPAEYLASHAHLAYAATAYGVQGVTADQPHTVLSDRLGAAGLYVGMTRGRETNRLHIVAGDIADAKAQFVEVMGRDRANRGLDHAAQAARETEAAKLRCLSLDEAAALVRLASCQDVRED